MTNTSFEPEFPAGLPIGDGWAPAPATENVVFPYDGSVIAQGYAPTKFTKTFNAKTTLAGITAIRLELLNDPAALSARSAPFGYALVLSAAFVGQLAGDPNAVDRARDLIRRRVAEKIQTASWRTACVNGPSTQSVWESRSTNRPNRSDDVMSS